MAQLVTSFQYYKCSNAKKEHELFEFVRLHKDILREYNNTKVVLHDRARVELANELAKRLEDEQKQNTGGSVEAGANQDKLDFIASWADRKELLVGKERAKRLVKTADGTVSEKSSFWPY